LSSGSPGGLSGSLSGGLPGILRSGSDGGMRKSRLALSLKVCTVVCEVVCVADFLTVCAEAYRMACIEFHLVLSLKVCAMVCEAVCASQIWRLALRFVQWFARRHAWLLAYGTHCHLPDVSLHGSMKFLIIP
jgi:hypothetical protein